MASNKPPRRMPLHQLLAHTEKHNRDLVEFIHGQLHPRVTELQEMTKTLAAGGEVPPKALQSALRHVDETGTQFLTLLDELVEAMDIIHEHANRDRVERLN